MPERLNEARGPRYRDPAGEIMSFAINLGHAGGVIGNNLRDLIEKMIGNRLVFSAEGQREIFEHWDRVLENLRPSLGVFMSGRTKVPTIFGLEGRRPQY